MTNKKSLLYVLIYFSLLRVVLPQGTWMWTNRTHPELTWQTIETEHFNIHYHNGIEEIARQGASISEQVWPILLEQLDLQKISKVDITFTSEDEIMNGYAMWSNQVFIWVDQNDAAIWLEDEKWLYQVVAHELQHIVLMNALKTWVPEPWSIFLISGTPGWFVEGTAEYYTEKWRPYRSDLSHKWHILKNKMGSMDPHHDGFSKMKYWADRFGDSTIVKVVQHRNKLKLFRFKEAFKEVTGIKLSQFEEDWRRLMNTYYYGYKAQKESFEDVGRIVSLPVKEATRFAVSPDSMKIAIVGRDDKDQWDQSLFIAIRDTTKQKKYKFLQWFKKKEEDKKKKKPKVKYDVKEIDHGQIGFSPRWSPDGTQLIYPKYRYGKHGSMIWDIRVVNVETGKGSWITQNMRASYPDWSPDGKRIVFVAHKNSTANLFTIKPDGSDKQVITHYTEDTQLLSPRWSPDGSRIAFAVAGPDGNCDISILDVTNGETERITTNPEVDYLPVWHPDGSKITYTSHAGSSPNLRTVNLTTGESVQITDVGEAIWSVQWTPKGNTVLTQTLNDVDSVRVVMVDPNRSITTEPLQMRKSVTRWRDQTPENMLQNIDPEAHVDIIKTDSYKFYKHVKHFTSLAIPYINFSGFLGFTTWTDAMGRHLMQAGGATEWDGSGLGYFLSYINAQSGPLWGINYYFDTRWKFRFYDESRSGLSERLDGWNLWVSQPLNFGTSMSSNHSFEASLSIQNRVAYMPYDSVGTDGVIYYHQFTVNGLPKPESGQEGILSLGYKWVDRRPHKNNLVLPAHGWGVSVMYDLAQSSVYGDFTYRRLTMDSFANVGIGPAVLFLRGKTISLTGSPPPQEYVGLSNDPPIYGPGDNQGGLGFFLSLQENHNLRGWEGVRLGDRMFFGTTELRIPLIPSLPINIFGISIGDITGALISDVGNAWYANRDKKEWIVTGGYEVKVAVRIGDVPLFILAFGRAQTVEDWRNNKSLNAYARLALINPF